MNKKEYEFVAALTALMASAFTHHQKIFEGTGDEPPTPEESKMAYLNNPIINRLTDHVVYAVIEMQKTFNQPINSDRAKQPARPVI